MCPCSCGEPMRVQDRCPDRVQPFPTIFASMSLRRLIVVSLPLLVACSSADKASTAQASAPAAPPPAFDLARIDKARQMGSETAKVWFIEGSDFECPFCKAFRDQTWPRIEQE